MTQNAPESYEDLISAIHEKYDGLSRGYKQIARHLTQNPNDVAIRSVNSIARKCNAHASSLVRFAQIFGFKGFKDLQSIYQIRLATAAPGFEARVSALKTELALHSKEGMRGFLGDLVARDIASLQGLLADTPEDSLVGSVDILESAGTIYIAGQLRSAPIAQFLRYVLTMLSQKVVLLDADGGLSTEMARVMTPDDALIAISFRFYAKEVVDICEEAGRRGVPVIAISDSSLSPLAKSATVLFPIPEDEYSFSRSLAAPMCLAQALMIAFAARLDKTANDQVPRIPVLTERDMRK